MLLVNQISAQGFKSIRGLDNFGLRGLNVLIGANGAGKSNFLSLLQMMTAMMDHSLQLFVAKRSGPDALLFGGLKHT